VVRVLLGAAGHALRRRGLIGRDVMTAVCRSLPVVSAGQVVADVTAPCGGTAAEDQQHAAAAGGQ